MSTGADETPNRSATPWKLTRGLAIRIAFAYALIWTLWEFFSDWVLARWVVDPTLQTRLDHWSHWSFVLATAVLLGVALNGYFRQAQRSAQLIRESEQRWQSAYTDLHRAEAALHESELRHRLALEAAQIGTWDWDLTTDKVVWSANHEKLWAYSPGTFPGTAEGFSSRVHPDDLSDILRRGEELQKTRAPFQVDYRVVWPDGSVHWVTSHGRYLFDAQDRPVRIIGVVIDITTRKAAEQALREKEARLETLFEHSPAAIWEEDFTEVKNRLDALMASGVHDITPYLREHRTELAACAAAVKVVRINETSAKVFGMPKQEIPKHLPSYFTSASLDVFADELGSLAAGAKHWAGEIPIVSPNGLGRVLAISLSLVPHHEDTWSRVLVTFSDITERQLDQRLSQIQCDLALALGASRSLDTVIQVCLKATIAAEPLDWAGIHLLDELDGSLRLQGHTGNSKHFAGNAARYEADSPEAKSVMSGKPVYGQGLQSQFMVGMDETERENGLPFLGIIPIQHEGRIIGCLNAVSHSALDIPGALRTSLETIAAEAAHAITRLKAEAALKESEDRYRSLVEDSPDAIGIYQDEKLVFINSTAVRQLGAKVKADLLYKPTAEILHPDDRAAAAERIRRRMGGDTTVYPAEARYVRRDGSILPIEVSAAPVQFAGKPAVQLIARDISDRKRAEAELREGLLFRRQAEKIARIGAWKANLETDYLYWTEGVFEILELPQNHQPGLREGLKYYDAASLPVLHAALQAALQDGTPFVVETGLTTATGRHLWTEVRGLGRVLEGGQAWVMGTFQDITERKLAEHRAKQDGERTELLLELHRRAPQMSDRELFDYVLDKAVKLTDSETGFFHRVSADQNQIILTAWNEEALKSCTAQFDTHYPLSQAGNWVDCVRERRPVVYNDYAQSPNQHGLPQGHAPVRRFMSIPVIQEGKVHIIFGVGNKVLPYHEGDVAQLQLVANELDKVLRQREAETQLRKLSRAVEQNLACIFITDANGIIEYVNGRFTQITGYSKEEALGQNPRMLKSGQTPPEQYQELWSTLLQGNEWRGQFYNRKKNGEFFWEHAFISPIKSPEGIVTHFVAVKEDITDRKRVEAALERSNERYRSLIETTFDWVWEVDANGRYTYASPRVEEILGYKAEQVLGRSPFDFMPPVEAARVGAIFQEALTRRAPFTALENTNLHQNGREIVLESSGMPVLGPNGELLGYRGMDRDITARKRLEDQLRQSQKLEAIGQLAGGVAHDFNNILAAMMMTLALTQLNPGLDAETRQALQELEAEAKRAENLTRQLLMLSRRSVLSVKPLDLNALVANLLKMLGRLIGEHIELRFHRPSTLPMVEADAGMLDQVLMNLVVNARDAMPKGGRITIRTNLVDVRAEETPANPNRRSGPFVCLEVTDQGCGMDHSTLKRVFEPFFTTKEAGKGTGLGLATVYGIVGQHKGWVDIESQLQHGTTFRVYLPPIRDPVASPALEDSSRPIRQGRERILIVEDETKVRSLLARSLRLLGYEVSEAGTGPEALACWQEQTGKFDLLLTDMVMPGGMTGLELSEKLLAENPGLAAIISSGYSAEIAKEGAPTRAGITYIQKPYDLNALSNVVRSSLDKRYSRAD